MSADKQALSPDTRAMIRENAIRQALLLKRVAPAETQGRSIIEIAAEIEAFVTRPAVSVSIG
jgi:hypothetical protein